jgi:hypothetical protein
VSAIPSISHDFTAAYASDYRLYIIPGSEYPIHRAILQKDDLILISSHGRARVWNLVSGEFRRSTSMDAAAEMLVSGEWLELSVKVDHLEEHDLTIRFRDRPLGSHLDRRSSEPSQARKPSPAPTLIDSCAHTRLSYSACDGDAA